MSKGADIERESFQIIDKVTDLSRFNHGQKTVTARIIHATGDPEYAELMRFSPAVVTAAIDAILTGMPVVTDVMMVKAGITKRFLDAAKLEVHCFINDEDVIAAAGESGGTRAEHAMMKAASLMPNAIYVIGNAPTALLKLLELAKAGKLYPSLIIGLPVGFVMASESKEMLIASDLPAITNKGTKGGSPVAAAALNACIALAVAN